jgi:mitochondrial import inner membrane translocase subunit TIM44
MFISTSSCLAKDADQDVLHMPLQINCTRDKFGNVTEGAPDEVTRVFYFWALQQEAAGFVGTDGKLYPPRWQLREMLVQGMMQLVS